MIVNLFKHGSDEFIQLLDEASIEYQAIGPPIGDVMNAPVTIEIIKALSGLAIAPALAAVLVQWLKNKSARKIMLTDNKGCMKQIEGYSVNEVEKLLLTVKTIEIIQTKSDEKIAEEEV